MPLDPVIVAMLEQMRIAGRPALSAGSPNDARAMLRTTRAALGSGPEMREVTDVLIPARGGGRKARVFRPDCDPVGVVAYFHGGGWVLGELEDYDALARSLAARSRCVLVLPDYRLAPEHPFPDGLEDAQDAVLWASDHIGELAGHERPLVVGGDSAGANLATVALARLRGRVKAAGQVLIYPVAGSDTETSSYLAYGEGLPLTRKDMEWFFGLYAPANLHSDPRISPLSEPDLSGLPPTVVLTAEYDVLRDEGEDYARRLAEAGVEVIVRRVAGLPHGFIRLHNLVAAADAALCELARDIGRLCARSGK